MPKAKTPDKVEIMCNECGRHFRRRVPAKTAYIKCPKCGGYDTELAGVYDVQGNRL